MNVPEALLRVQACAFNAKDAATIVGHYTRSARFVRDGRHVGEGQDAVLAGFEQEWRNGVIGRVADVDGEPVLVEMEGENGPPRGVIRFHTDGDRITECVVDHDAKALQHLWPTR